MLTKLNLQKIKKKSLLWKREGSHKAEEYNHWTEKYTRSVQQQIGWQYKYEAANWMIKQWTNLENNNEKKKNILKEWR